MIDPTRALEWMIGVPAITFLRGEDGAEGEARIHIEMETLSAGCARCGVVARAKGRSRAELIDLPMFGRPMRLVWRKRRWMCADADCPKGSWTEEEHRIAAPRQVLTARAARWATVQVGRRARSVNEVAQELGCDWHTVNDTVVAYDEALVDADGDRIGEVTALGLDEVPMVRLGPFHRQHFTTQLVDVRRVDLNLVEQVWENLKGTELANLCPDTIDEAEAAVDHGLCRIGTETDLCFSFIRHTGLRL